MMTKKIGLLLLTMVLCTAVNADDPARPMILTNHIGYKPTGPKTSIILGFENDKFQKFKLINFTTEEIVFEGKVNAKGPVQKWKNWNFWTLDFSSVTEEGKYYIISSSKGREYRSFPFDIQEDILERHTISDIVYYLKGQRSEGLFAKADKHIPVMRYTDAEKEKTEIIRYVDASGGWADATGDYSKVFSHLSHSIYFNPQQIPITSWSLFKSYEETGRREKQGFTQFRKRMLDEALNGADFFVNMKIPDGSFYIEVSCWGEKRPEDRKILPTNSETGTYNTSYREGAGLAIATLAMASTCHVSGEYSNGQYLRTAEDAFEYLEKNNAGLSRDGKENILDDYCALMAAVELYKATNKSVYKETAERRAESLMSRLVSSGSYTDYWRADDKDRPFFHAAEPGLPVVSLLSYATMVEGQQRQEVLSVVRRSMEYELAITNEVNNPFGYARQYVQHLDGKRESGFFFAHDTETEWWWQGENARLGSMASAAKLAAQFFEEDETFQKRLRDYATNQLNWVLGLNPYDACMLEGSGRNNPQYLFYGTYEYKSAPGGIVNGITAGMDDYHDIEFDKGYIYTGEDDDWRWLEQWIPHAAWFLYAVSLE